MGQLILFGAIAVNLGAGCLSLWNVWRCRRMYRRLEAAREQAEAAGQALGQALSHIAAGAVHMEVIAFGSEDGPTLQ